MITEVPWVQDVFNAPHIITNLFLCFLQNAREIFGWSSGWKKKLQDIFPSVWKIYRYEMVSFLFYLKLYFFFFSFSSSSSSSSYQFLVRRSPVIFVKQIIIDLVSLALLHISTTYLTRSVGVATVGTGSVIPLFRYRTASDQGMWILMKSLFHVYHLTMEILISFFKMESFKGASLPSNPMRGRALRTLRLPENCTSLKFTPMGLYLTKSGSKLIQFLTQVNKKENPGYSHLKFSITIYVY